MIPLPTLAPATLRACAVVLALAAAFSAGWEVNGWRLGREAAQEAQERGEAILREHVAAEDRADALRAQVAAVDAAGTERLRRLNAENDALRNAATTGGVRVHGTHCHDVPQAADGAGVDSGTGAELDAGTRQLVYDYRARLIRAGEKLAACQALVREQLSPR